MTLQLPKTLKVLNIGVQGFTEALNNTNTSNIHLDWRPPVSIPLEMKNKMLNKKQIIDEANNIAIKKIISGRPYLIGMGRAIDVIPNMTSETLLHAGPPINWDRMCGPMKGAMIGALIYEGMANNEVDAIQKLSTNRIKFSPCHEHSAVGPMAGVISPSMPVFIIKNDEYSNLAYTTMNEGLGKVLRYGAFSEEVIKRLKWMEEILYPTLKYAIDDYIKSNKIIGIDLKSIIAQALHMGDEVHNRNRAGTSLFYRTIAPYIVKTANNKDDAIGALNFINGNDHFFLNLSMAASKSMLMPAHGTPNSSIVTIMARNGTDFGIKVAGLKNAWFTGAAEIPNALFFPGYSKNDANPDIGDSAITETCGLGGSAMAAAFAIVQFVGGSASDAIKYTNEMYEITTTENTSFQIPSLDFRGTPTGIDIRKVIEKNIFPFINTGVAHKNAGVGQVGAGVLSAPKDPFIKAYLALSE